MVNGSIRAMPASDCSSLRSPKMVQGPTRKGGRLGGSFQFQMSLSLFVKSCAPLVSFPLSPPPDGFHEPRSALLDVRDDTATGMFWAGDTENVGMRMCDDQAGRSASSLQRLHVIGQLQRCLSRQQNAEIVVATSTTLMNTVLAHSPRHKATS